MYWDDEKEKPSVEVPVGIFLPWAGESTPDLLPAVCVIRAAPQLLLAHAVPHQSENYHPEYR